MLTREEQAATRVLCELIGHRFSSNTNDGGMLVYDEDVGQDMMRRTVTIQCERCGERVKFQTIYDIYGRSMLDPVR